MSNALLDRHDQIFSRGFRIHGGDLELVSMLIHNEGLESAEQHLYQPVGEFDVGDVVVAPAAPDSCLPAVVL